MKPPRMLATAALFGGLAVIFGAFAAHALESRLEPHALRTFETAVRYQMYHALALGLCAVAGMRRPPSAAAWCFAAGIVLFSGSLYLLVFTQASWLGAVTPFGGVLFVVGWILLGWSALRQND